MELNIHEAPKMTIGYAGGNSYLLIESGGSKT